MKKLFATLALACTGLSLSAQTWEQLNYTYDYSGVSAPKVFVSPDDGIIIAGIRSGAKKVSVSKDGGQTWQDVFPDMAVINAMFGPDGTAYLMTSKRYMTTSIYNPDTLYTSADGLNWTNAGYKLKGGSEEYEFAITGNNTLLFPNGQSSGSKLASSTDNGQSWTDLAESYGPVAASYSADTIIISDDSPWPGGIRYSHDGGATFSDAAGINAASIPQVLPNGEVWAASIGKVWKSTDGGASFTGLSPDPWVPLQIKEFIYGSNGRFYIRGVGQILETADGVLFTDVTNSLPDASLLMDISLSENYIYAVTDKSIYRYPLGTNTSVANPVSPSLMNVYPNPATGRVYVDLPHEQLLRIQLADQTGRILRTAEGERSVSLEGICPGVYFLRATSAKSELVQKLIVQ